MHTPIQILNHRLPEFCTSGRSLESIDGVILHYFSARNVDKDNEFDLQACFDLFVDLNQPMQHRDRYMTDKPWGKPRMYASAHFLIGRDGEIWQLVDLDKQTYHAGASILNGRDNCNNWTLGIELVGHQHSGFTEEQYESLGKLLARLEADYQFPRENVAGHDLVRYNAMQKRHTLKAKYDPSGRKDGKGDNFDWPKLFTVWNEYQPEINQEVKSGIV